MISHTSVVGAVNETGTLITVAAAAAAAALVATATATALPPPSYHHSPRPLDTAT